MPIDVVVGLQRGDEGKGRFVDKLAADYDIVARFNGGNNAGHTVVLKNGDVLKLHLIPSGIAHAGKINIIGSGTLLNAPKLVDEIGAVRSRGIDVSESNLKISSGAHLILPHHICDDEIRESTDGRQGSTKSGIAQVSSLKAMRTSVRAEMIKENPAELRTLVYAALIAQQPARKAAGLDEIDAAIVADEFIAQAKLLVPLITDTVFYINQELRKEKPAKVLAEGAQAFLLDIDHGMYPFTTSSSTTSGGVPSGLGVPPSMVGRVIGVAKAVQSHVGGGPFVTEVEDLNELAGLHGDMTTVDAEYGTTTGRKRRLGYIDLPQIRRANMVNGTNAMILSKLDWVPRYGKEVKVCVEYKRSGKTLTIAPDSALKLQQSTPVYTTLPTWDENIQDIRQFNDLPKNARDYVEFIEQQTGVPISIIGVGPNPDQIIQR